MKFKPWLLIFALWFFPACTALQGGESVDDRAASLVDTKWRLSGFSEAGGETPIVGGSSPTLEFQGDNLAGGSGGCNSFGGKYEAQGDRLSFSELASTLMACAENSITNQEQRYFEALQTAERYEVSGDRLTIGYGDGESSLKFVRVDAQ